MKRAPFVTLSCGRRSVWAGSLATFLRDIEMPRGDRRYISAELRAHGRAFIGGGAAPQFTLRVRR